MSTTPAMRLKIEGESALWVQAGAVYAEGGNRLRTVPDWFWNEARKTSPEVRKEVGLVLPEEGAMPEIVKAAPALEPAPTEDPAPPEGATYEELAKYLGLPSDIGEELAAPRVVTWECDECSEVVETRKKGVHIAAHRRDAKRGVKDGN